MAEKREIRSLIKNLLPAIDKVNKYHPSVIDRAIERVLIEMYQELFAVDVHALMRFTKGYGYNIPIAVNLRTSTGTYYSTLPAKIISFRDKASGVRRISSPISTGFTFVPVDAREVDLLMGGSNTNTVTSKVGYLVTHTEVEYYKRPTGLSWVKMDLIIPFSQYEETDTVLIPESTPGRQEATFIERVLAILGVIQPKDQKDDNADKVRQINNKQ